MLYKKFLDMAQYKPSPISIFDALIGMAIAVYRRGTPECVEYYQTLCDEIEEKVAKGIGVVQNEKYRLYWENLPVWFKFSDHAKLLASYGAVILTSLYVHAWSLDFDLNKDPLVTLAENYVDRFSNSTIEDRATMAMDLFKKYDMNGNDHVHEQKLQGGLLRGPDPEGHPRQEDGNPRPCIRERHGGPKVLF